jgi:hypothetical protein
MRGEIKATRREELFVRHARRLRDSARRARRLASAVAGDIIQERLLSLADRLDARSAVAQYCAEEATRREADRQKRPAGARGGIRPAPKPSG